MHAVIEVTAQGCKVTDLGSANGTFVDGRPVSSRPLKSGQTIRFGTDHEFLFVEAGAQILKGVGGRGSPASVSTTTGGGAPVQQQKLVLLAAVAIAVAVMGAVLFFLLAQ
jgi:pSer/pThr/pTyr-binding forkhead associated (FHA) protein